MVSDKCSHNIAIKPSKPTKKTQEIIVFKFYIKIWKSVLSVYKVGMCVLGRVGKKLWFSLKFKLEHL